MGSLLDRLISFLEPFFSRFGYLFILAGTFMEGSFVFGWLAPGTILILIGSFYAAQGLLSPFWVCAAAFAGCVVGDGVGYYLGRAPGNRIIKRFGHRLRIREGVESSERYFQHYGGVTVLFGRIVPGINVFVPFTAGLNHMSFGKFLAYDVPSSFLYVVLFTFIGYFFGNNWKTVEKILSSIGWGVFGLIVLLVLIFWFLKRRRKSTEGLEEEESEDPGA